MHGGTGHHLHGVWGSSDNDVFAVGVSGCILHYDGKKWKPMKSGTTDTPFNILEDVWGSSDSNVFAVGDRLLADDDQPCVLHYDGSSWSDMSTPTSLCSLWGDSENDVFATSCSGMIVHYDGSTWSIIFGTPGSLHGIWGSSGNNVFAVGEGFRVGTFGDFVRFGAILHYDGSTWTDMSSNTTVTLRGVWGSSENDVFAVGDSGTILHYDGNEWSTVTSGIAPDLYAVWGNSGSDVFAVGDWGTVLRYDGSTWSRMDSGTRGSISSTYPLRGVWGSSDNDVFAVGSETILHHPGHFTIISPGVDWGLVGRITAAVVLVLTVFGLMIVINRSRGKTVSRNSTSV